jgi:hypothetical protein
MSSQSPWNHSIKKTRDKFAHPNSLYAKAKDNPTILDKIIRGLREADEDLANMERWYRRGFR